MTIEKSLERIADALEKAIELKFTPGHPEQKSYVEERLAAAKAEPMKRPPVTPKKFGLVKEPEKEDDFLDGPVLNKEPEKVYTEEEVRAALVAYKDFAGSKDKALEVLARAGDGATRVPELKTEFYGAVIKALAAATAKHGK